MHQQDPQLTRVATEVWLRKKAKQMHRAATSNSRMRALPVLRRLIASKTFRDISLVELYNKREMVQRKHILHLLALESGHPDWATFKCAIMNFTSEEGSHFSFALKDVGYPNVWFRSIQEAKEYNAIHGGNFIKVGEQAVVVPTE